MEPSAADYYIPLCILEGFHGDGATGNVVVTMRGEKRMKIKEEVIDRSTLENFGAESP